MGGFAASRTIYTGSAVSPYSPPAPVIAPRYAPSGGSGFAGPRRVVAAPRVVTSARSVSVVPRGEFVSHYDPSRVIDLDRLKVVEDMRSGPEFAEERGDSTSGDNGVMSPSESAGGGRGMPGATAAPGTAKVGGGGLALAALAAFLLFGG